MRTCASDFTYMNASAYRTTAQLAVDYCGHWLVCAGHHTYFNLEHTMHIPKTLASSLLSLALIVSAPAGADSAAPAQDAEMPAPRAAVNINTADASSLAESLDGVGLSRAQSIIDWREANGPFEDPYDLVQVRGISERIVSLNETRIRVEAEDGYTDE